MELKLIDAHLHIWDINHLTYPWLSEVPEINKSFDLESFRQQTDGLKIQDSSLIQEPTNLHLEKMIFIQCECLPTQYLDEVKYITKLATIDDRIQGIIPWFPLDDAEAEQRLQKLIKNPLIKGIRRQEETPVSLFSNPIFINNLDLLSKYNLTFDICAKNELLTTAIKMVEKKPDINYMLDHMGKPDIKNKEINSWKNNIRLLAENPNVYCKVSGLVTEADLQNWNLDRLRPYFDYALEQFGTDRLVFGGDWPVLNLASSYQEWINTVMILCKGFSEEDLNKIFNENASRFYGLN